VPLLTRLRFVNAHTHSSEMWVRGLVAPVPLELWLADIIELGAAQVDDEAYYLAALHVAVETLQSGGTCVLDHLAVDPARMLPTLAAAVRAYRQAGIRAVICPLVSDLPLAQSVVSAAYTPVEGRVQQIMAFMEEAVRQFHRPAEGISIGIGPTGVQRCSDQLFTALVGLARAHNLPRHSHVLETRQQRLLSEGKFGCSAVEHMRQLGFLEGPGCSLAHAIHWSPEDMALAAAAGCSVVHNPLSNLRLGSGRCPIEGFQAPPALAMWRTAYGSGQWR
jgi:5-methylthioadenosine/S-adenosylhomocysteine deaminase